MCACQWHQAARSSHLNGSRVSASFVRFSITYSIPVGFTSQLWRRLNSAFIASCHKTDSWSASGVCKQQTFCSYQDNKGNEQWQLQMCKSKYLPYMFIKCCWGGMSASVTVNVTVPVSAPAAGRGTGQRNKCGYLIVSVQLLFIWCAFFGTNPVFN